MLKVLIAEDDLLIADLAEETLTEHGYEVCGIGRNVADSLALASRHKPDLAILDVRLADGDMGTAIAAELTDRRNLGILYVTGNIAAVEQAAVHGHACLQKPYRSMDLLRSLEIVAEMIDSGTTSLPFPPNFRVLPEGLTLSEQDPDDDRVRVRTLLRQQSVTAAFGSYVLGEVDLPMVLAEAVRVCAEGLKAAFCKVYRYRPTQDDLIREVGFGWHAGVNEHSVLRADASSPEGCAFVSRSPVICNATSESISSNRRELHAVRAAVSTVDVIINGADGKPYGVLGASDVSRQAYDQNDAGFLSGIANIVAGAIVNAERTKVPHQMIERLQNVTAGTDQLSEQAQVSGAIPGTLGAASSKVVDPDLANPMPDVVSKTEIDGTKGKPHVIPRTTATPNKPHARAMSNAPNWRVLLVEDDTDFRDNLVEHFVAEGGFTVVTAGTLAEADKALAEDHCYFNTILLDVKVPDGDGCEYCAKLRQLKYGMPIMMLTGANEEVDVVRGLDAGADDYIPKPFKWNELLARLRVQRRLFDSSEEAVFVIGPYLFWPAKRLLEDNVRNRRIRLTNMESAVLRYLYHKGPIVVAHQVLAQDVWGHNSRVTTHTLETHMYRLRQKMEANPGTPVLLLTERGGYRLNANPAGTQNAPANAAIHATASW
jgi:DNA-binding response OmpR family regulator